MTQQFVPWPPAKPFPESMRDSTGGNQPDFPGSSGGREQGKHRPSRTPLLTQVAVTNDDGTPVGRTTDEMLTEMLLYQKATLFALGLMVGWTSEELLTEVEG